MNTMYCKVGRVLAASAALLLPGPSFAAGKSGSTAPRYASPFAYCAAVKTIDQPDRRFSGPDSPPVLERAMGNRGPVAWRCVAGQVLACRMGASGSGCLKIGGRLVPHDGIREFCRDYPGSEFVPMSVLGDSPATWRCAGSVPVIIERTPTDARGFKLGNWKRVKAP